MCVHSERNGSSWSLLTLLISLFNVVIIIAESKLWHYVDSVLGMEYYGFVSLNVCNYDQDRFAWECNRTKQKRIINTSLHAHDDIIFFGVAVGCFFVCFFSCSGTHCLLFCCTLHAKVYSDLPNKWLVCT